MTPDSCRHWRERLGAFVLGHLDHRERAALEAHLDGCPACRAEAAELRPVAERLAFGNADRLGARPAPPRALGDRVLARIDDERRARRRGRRRLAARVAPHAAAAAAIGAAAAALLPGVLGGESTRPAGRAVAVPAGETVAFSGLPPGVAIRATLDRRPWGTAIAVRVRGARPGMECTVWLRAADGTRVPAGSFRYTARGRPVTLAAALDRSDATAIGMKVAGRYTYVERLPRG